MVNLIFELNFASDGKEGYFGGMLNTDWSCEQIVVEPTAECPVVLIES